MRALILAAGAALTLAACGGGETEANNDMNALAGDNAMVGDNAMMGDINAVNGGMDANAATNAATENAVINDLTNNDADTNLANGT